MNAATGMAETAMEVGTIGKARKVAQAAPHTTPQALAVCAGLAVAVPQFEVQPERGPDRRVEVQADGRAVVEAGPLKLTLGWLGDAKSGRRIAVTLVQMKFLEALMLAGGAVVTQAALMHGRMWAGRPSKDRTVTMHIATLRRKLADIRSAVKIRTHAGMGYSMEWPGMVVKMGQAADPIQNPQSKIQNAEEAA